MSQVATGVPGSIHVQFTGDQEVRLIVSPVLPGYRRSSNCHDGPVLQGYALVTYPRLTHTPLDQEDHPCHSYKALKLLLLEARLTALVSDSQGTNQSLVMERTQLSRDMYYTSSFEKSMRKTRVECRA